MFGQRAFIPAPSLVKKQLLFLHITKLIGIAIIITKSGILVILNIRCVAPCLMPGRKMTNKLIRLPLQQNRTKQSQAEKKKKVWLHISYQNTVSSLK